MHFLRLSFCLLLLIACNSKKTTEDVAKIKANHKTRIELIRVAPEPLYEKISDSMKKWIPIFRNVLADDQKNRIIGYNKYTKEEKNEQLALDSQNLKIVTSYLDKYGWPTIYDIGFIGQRAINMCIQHSPLNTQEKYYPDLVEAYKKDSFLFETLALLEDRINMRNHKYQYYGSQVIIYKGKQTLYPVFNIDSIDAIRKRIGIKMPLQQYLLMLKVNWDINEYKRILPELISELKVSDTPGVHFNKN